MKYCRVSIDHTTRGCVYKKDFDPQHIFGPLVRAFASELIRQGAIKDGEHYTSIITPRYEDTLVQTPIVRIDQATAQEPRASWFNVEFQNGQTGQPLAFFTMELRFQESGIIYRQDLQIINLDYFWQNIQAALVRMHVLRDGDLYVPHIAVYDDDQANFTREEVHVAPSEEETSLFELVEIESTAPDFPPKSPADFAVIEVKDVALVSLVELDHPPDAAQLDRVQVFIAQPTLEALQAIASRDVQAEQGGVLVGQVYRHADGYLIEITGHIVAEDANANLAEFRYNFDSWVRQSETLKEQYAGQQIVGWYHTHLVSIAIQPDESNPELQTTELFFSDHDRFMHRQFFGDPWYVAMVLGPQGNAAFFRWFGDKISANRQFYVFRSE